MGLPTPYQEYIHLSRYARYNYVEKRRETWEETVDRYFTFFQEHLKEMCDFKMTDKAADPIKKAVLELKVMPSMRCLMTAGEALKRENVYIQTVTTENNHSFLLNQTLIISIPLNGHKSYKR